MTEPQKMINKKIIGIALIALLLAMYSISALNITVTAGGVSFNGSVVDLNGSSFYNGSQQAGTFNYSNLTNLPNMSEKLIASGNLCCGSIEYINVSGLSINIDRFYKIYTVFNVSTSATALKIFVNDDFNEANYTRQYVYASGATIIVAADASTDVSAASPAMSSSSKILMQRSNSGSVRMIIEGNLDEGISFFNMQMMYNNHVNDVTKITLKLVPSGNDGLQYQIFALR